MQPIQVTSSNSTAFVNTNQAIASTNTTYSQAQFPHVTQVSNIVEPLTTSYPVYSTFNQIASEKFKFKQRRDYVPQSMWNSFCQPLDKQSFHQLYSDFLLTNWCLFHQFKFESAEQKKIAKKNQNWIELFDQTVEAHFQQNLKLNAAFLIHQILELGKLNYRLSSPSTVCDSKLVYSIKNKMSFIIEKINNNYTDAYENAYFEYEVNKKNANHEKTEEAINILNIQIKRMRDFITAKGMGAKDDEEIAANLPYINRMLSILRENANIPHSTAVKIAKAYLPSQRKAEFSQQDEPSTKKRRVNEATLSQMNALSSPPNTYMEQASFSQAADPSANLLQYNTDIGYSAFTAQPFDLQQGEGMKNIAFSQEADPPYSLPQYSTDISYPKFAQNQAIDLSLPLRRVEDSIQSRNLAFNHSVAFIPNRQVLCTSPLPPFEFPQDIPCISQETILISMLEKIAGKECFFYDESKVKTETPNYPEHYYYSELMLAALNGQMNLIKMKSLTAELIVNESRDHAKVSVIRKQIARNLAYLIESTLIHQKIIARIQCEKMHVFPESMPYNKMLCNAAPMNKKIDNARINLNKTLSAYNKIIATGDEKAVLIRLYRLMNEKIIISALAKSFSSLQEDRIIYLIRVALNITSDSIPALNQLLVLKFKLDRMPVTNKFWDLLKVEISESDFRKQYAEFILTNWKSSKLLKAKENKRLKEAKEKRDQLEQYNILIDKCFQKKLELRACQLINLILIVIKSYKSLDNPNQDTLNKIFTTQEKNICDINNSSDNAYQLYKEYLTERKLFQSISSERNLGSDQRVTTNFLYKKIDELKVEITSNQRSIHNNLACNVEEMSKHLILINNILKELENNKRVTHEILVGLICSNIKESQNDTDGNSEAAFASESHATSCQVQFAPASFDESVAQHTRVSFSPQPSTSQQASDMENISQNPINEQDAAELSELSPQPEQVSDLDEQFNEFLGMDDNALLDFLMHRHTE